MATDQTTAARAVQAPLVTHRTTTYSDKRSRNGSTLKVIAFR